MSSLSLAYVGEIPKPLPVLDAAGRRSPVDRIHRVLSGAAWQLRSQGPGEKDERTHGYAMIPVAPVREAPADSYAFTLLIRKKKLKTVKEGTSVYEFTYLLVHAPHGTSLKQIIAWTGLRRNVGDEDNDAKNKFVLEDCQVHTVTSWRR